MTRKQLATRVEYWRGRIAPEWRITLRSNAPDDLEPGTFLACVQVPTDYHAATMHFTDEVLESDPLDVDRVIAHELLHLLVDDLNNAVATLGPLVPDVQWRAYKATFTQGEERLVDRVSRILSGTLTYGIDDKQDEE